MKIVVVYGCSSFIGRALCNNLSKSQYRILFLNSRSDVDVNLLKLKQIFDTEPLSSAFWIHTAFFTDKKTSLQNIFSSLSVNNDLLYASMQLFDSISLCEKKFIFLSSDRVGTSSTNFDEKSISCQPVDAYGLSKSVCESILLARNNILSNHECTIVRACSIYGPGQLNHQFIPKILISAKEKKPINLGSLDDKRSFLFIDDFVDGLSKIFRLDSWSSDIYHFTTSPVSLSYVVSECLHSIDNVFDLSESFISFDDSLHINKSPMLKPIHFSDDFTRCALNWQPAVDLGKGILSTCRWIKAA